MYMKKIRLVLSVAALICHVASVGQSLHTFKYRVKGISEFFARWNGDEYTDMIDPEAPDFNRQRLFQLFDCYIEVDSGDVEKEVVEFTDSVIGNNVRLGFDEPSWWAEAIAIISDKKGADCRIGMLLKMEQYAQNRYRWAIDGINGLDKAGFLNLSASGAISPTENEIGFIELESIFEYNKEDIAGYRSSDAAIDQLSAFLALAQAGLIKYHVTEAVRYHFLCVPGFIFTVDHFYREGSNAGWLISSIRKADDAEKSSYLDSLRGKQSN